MRFQDHGHLAARRQRANRRHAGCRRQRQLGDGAGCRSDRARTGRKTGNIVFILGINGNATPGPPTVWHAIHGARVACAAGGAADGPEARAACRSGGGGVRRKPTVGIWRWRAAMHSLSHVARRVLRSCVRVGLPRRNVCGGQLLRVLGAQEVNLRTGGRAAGLARPTDMTEDRPRLTSRWEGLPSTLLESVSRGRQPSIRRSA